MMKEKKIPTARENAREIIIVGLMINIILALLNVALFYRHPRTEEAKKKQVSLAPNLKAIDKKLQNLQKQIDEARESITPLERLKYEFSMSLDTPLGLIGTQIKDIGTSLDKWQGKKVDNESKNN